jgi:gliding motility-associated protein GldM
MINMMYLVLTAMLALNISKDILDALTRLNVGLGETAAILEKKNAETYGAIDIAAKDNPAKAGPYKAKAEKVRAAANDLDGMLEDLKTKLIETTGGYEEGEDGKPTNKPKGLDNREKAADLLLNQKKATELKGKINAFRDLLLENAADNEALKSSINAAFNTGEQRIGGANLDWEHATFEHFPLAAILAFMSDYQAKVRSAESDMAGYLRDRIGAGDFKFSTVKAIAIPKSNYVTQGGQFESDVLLIAFDDTQDPEIEIFPQVNDKGDPIGPTKMLSKDDIEGGMGKVVFPATGAGERKWGGVIRIKKGDGSAPEEIRLPAQTYTVAPPSVVISPTKMNVLYRGVDNPIEISVPGVDPRKIRVSGPGVSGSNGNYVADVTKIQGKEVTISVAVDEDGKSKSMGSKVFRIKGLPQAEGMVYGKSTGMFSASAVKKATIEAKFSDFPFDLELAVNSFEIKMEGFPPKQVSGNKMPSDVQALIDRLKPNSTVTIRNIKATGPKGLRVTNIGNISIDVN